MNDQDLSRIVTAVAEMRAAQREYFTTRSSTALRKSKALERRVDELLDEVRKRVPPAPNQQGLF